MKDYLKNATKEQKEKVVENLKDMAQKYNNMKATSLKKLFDIDKREAQGLINFAWRRLSENINDTKECVYYFEEQKDNENANLAKKALVNLLKDFTAVVEADIQ